MRPDGTNRIFCFVHNVHNQGFSIVSSRSLSNTTADSRLRGQKSRGTQSIDRALDLLSLVSLHHVEGISVAALAENTGLDRTTVHRMIKALENKGLVHREQNTKGYRLGTEAFSLGQTSLLRPPLVQEYQPLMKSLVRKLDQPLFLVVRSADYSHCLHLEIGSRPVRDFGETVGTLRLLGLGIPSFALLANFDSDAVTEHYLRHQAEYQANRMTLQRLNKWVRETQMQGFAHIYAKGIRGVGVYFRFGTNGEAALGFVAPRARIPHNQAREIADLLKSAVLQASSSRLPRLIP